MSDLQSCDKANLIVTKNMQNIMEADTHEIAMQLQIIALVKYCEKKYLAMSNFRNSLSSQFKMMDSVSGNIVNFFLISWSSSQCCLTGNY
jgi:hypothetical protein